MRSPTDPRRPVPSTATSRRSSQGIPIDPNRHSVETESSGRSSIDPPLTRRSSADRHAPHPRRGSFGNDATAAAHIPATLATAASAPDAHPRAHGVGIHPANSQSVGGGGVYAPHASHAQHAGHAGFGANSEASNPLLRHVLDANANAAGASPRSSAGFYLGGGSGGGSGGGGGGMGGGVGGGMGGTGGSSVGGGTSRSGRSVSSGRSPSPPHSRRSSHGPPLTVRIPTAAAGAAADDAPRDADAQCSLPAGSPPEPRSPQSGRNSDSDGGSDSGGCQSQSTTDSEEKEALDKAFEGFEFANVEALKRTNMERAEEVRSGTASAGMSQSASRASLAPLGGSGHNTPGPGRSRVGSRAEA